MKNNQIKKYFSRILAFVLLAGLLTGAVSYRPAQASAKPKCSLEKRTKTTATIKIEKQKNVTGYRVYAKASKKGKYQLIMATRTSRYQLIKLKTNKVYYVKVRAYRTYGYRVSLGKYSNTIKVGKYQKKVKKKNKSKKKNKKKKSLASVQKQYAKQVLELVNEERTAAGLPEMTLDDTLCEAANERAEELVEQFSHTRPDGTDCFTVLQEYDYSYTAVGENIAASQDQQTPEDVVKSWMESPGHRANILSADFHKLGVGYYKVSSGYRYYWVQIFSS